jgi:hypothetical protein
VYSEVNVYLRRGVLDTISVCGLRLMRALVWGRGVKIIKKKVMIFYFLLQFN